MASETMMMGAACNGIVAALLNRDTVLADFGRRAELEGLEDQAYHPLSLYIDLCDYLEQRLGVYAFLRVGRRMAGAVMATAFPPDLSCVEEAVAQIDGAHQVFCRPVIGAFELVHRGDGQLTVRYTAPYNCILQEGLLYELAIRYGAPQASVSHVECRRKGADACRFELRY